jgi:hypothetical protein
MPEQRDPEKIVLEIKRKTRRKYSSEEKIRHEPRAPLCYDSASALARTSAEHFGQIPCVKLRSA